MEKDGDAQRAYRFEARKRLYEQCEPLLFQLGEAAENARGRIHGLARTCRTGHLKDNGEGWLAKPEGYFFMSTMYRLLAPAAVFHMLRRRMTTVDLNVDRRIKRQYELSRILYRSFRDQYEIADLKPSLAQNLDRQGVLWGKLDNALEAMTPPDKDGVPQLITYGRFEQLYEQGSPALREISYLFVRFHPTTHPALWRMLISQLFIYETLIAIHRHHDDDEQVSSSSQLSDVQGSKLSYQTRDEQLLGTRDQAEVAAARRYVEGRLAA